MILSIDYCNKIKTSFVFLLKTFSEELEHYLVLETKYMFTIDRIASLFVEHQQILYHILELFFAGFALDYGSILYGFVGVA